MLANVSPPYQTDGMGQSSPLEISKVVQILTCMDG